MAIAGSQALALAIGPTSEIGPQGLEIGE
jgi:hypothetical protein